MISAYVGHHQPKRAVGLPEKIVEWPSESRGQRFESCNGAIRNLTFDLVNSPAK